ncbi:MAG TPA: hypothetical protein VGJ25_10110 [Gaiellaceae bacterium]
MSAVPGRRGKAESIAALALLGTGVVVVLAWITGLALLALLLAHRL